MSHSSPPSSPSPLPTAINARCYPTTIECRPTLSVCEFIQEFLIPNIPVIVGPSLTSGWPARSQWVTSDGSPNFDFLASLFADASVTVAICDRRQFSDQVRVDMRFSEFIEKWRAGCDLCYLKDWHFVKDCPQGYQPYTPPPPFSSDWLNVYWDSFGDHSDDYRFCYMGGDGTWTPFHEDVYRSYSWSANICGQKLWRLVAPNQEHLFTDSLGNTIYDLRNYDPAEFPRFTSAVQYEVVQNPGECLFVPSGWWHQVVNIGHCISINHNWANAYNLHHLVDRLQRDYRRVVHALRDVADMDGFAQHCQLVLRADSGIDHLMFVQFLAHMRRVYVGCSEDQPPPMLAAHPSSVALRQTDPHFWSKGEVGVALDRIRQAFLRLRDHDPATRSDPSLCQLIDNELRELDMWESKVQ